MDAIFARLAAARDRGVKVVVVGYHNPYSGGSGPGCSRLISTADTIVNTLNNELRSRAQANHLIFAPIRPVLDGHGAGSKDPWVFGRSCDLGGVVSAYTSTARPWCPADICASDGKKKVQARFDPHFNNSGTSHVAAVVEQALA